MRYLDNELMLSQSKTAVYPSYLIKDNYIDVMHDSEKLIKAIF